jgi:hypothetical protein
MSIEKEYLAKECDVDYDEYTSDKNLDPRDCISSEIINDIQNIINENRDSFYNIALDIKSGHFDFPPECIYEYLDLLFEEIKQKINNCSSTL